MAIPRGEAAKECRMRCARNLKAGTGDLVLAAAGNPTSGAVSAGTMARCLPDAEALMRSRYTAYVLKLEDYLLATWHPSTRPQQLDLGVRLRAAGWA